MGMSWAGSLQARSLLWDLGAAVATGGAGSFCVCSWKGLVTRKGKAVWGRLGRF